MICDICGAEAASDAKFCEACGYPFQTAKPESATAAPKPAAPSPAVPGTPPAGAPPAADPALIEKILAETERKNMKKSGSGKFVLLRPKLWAAVGLALLAGSLALPWMRLLPNRSFYAWQMPLLFLVTGRGGGLPFLSIGVAITVAVILGAIWLLRSQRPAAQLQGAGLAAFVLVVATLALSTRFWDASLAVGDAFPQLMKQKVILTDRSYETAYRFLGLHPEAPVGAGWTRPPSGVAFLRGMLGAGFLLALAGALVLLLTPVLVGDTSFGFTRQIPTTVAAAGIAILILGAAGLAVFELLPGKWYTAKAAVEMRVSGAPRAELTLVMCLNLSSPPVDCAMSLAGLYWKTQRPRDAMNLYQSIAKVYPDYVKVNRPLGLLYFSQRNYWEAVPRFRKVLAVKRRDREIREKLSQSLVMCGNDATANRRYSDAAALLTEAYGLMPENHKDPALNLSIARTYLRMGRIKDGVQYLRVAADLKPYDFELQNTVADLFLSVDNVNAAVFFYKRAIAAKHDFADAYVSLGDIYRDRLNDPNAAAEWYKNAMTVHEFSPAADRAKERLRRMGRPAQ